MFAWFLSKSGSSGVDLHPKSLLAEIESTIHEGFRTGNPLLNALIRKRKKKPFFNKRTWEFVRN